MKKIFSLIMVILIGTSLSAYAVKTYKVSKDVQAGISKYRAKNYVGALADLNKAIQLNPKDSIAYYYLGNVYASIGKQNKADESYAKVIEINEIPGLMMYAVAARACIVDKEKCGEMPELGQSAETTKFVRSGKFMDVEAKEQVINNQLDSAKNMINKNQDNTDFSKLRYLNDAKDEMPSDKEIADAVRTLAKVGFNPLNNPQLAQNIAGIDSRLYNLPYMDSRDNVSPELMQNYITNQLFTNFDFQDTNRGF